MKKIPRKAAIASLLFLLVLSTAGIFSRVAGAASPAPPSLSVSLGYADDSHGIPGAFPSPWCGDSSVAVFIGVGPSGCKTNGVTAFGTTDGGAVRINNTGSSSVTIDNVTVTLPVAGGGTPMLNPGTSYPPRPVAFNLWGSFTIPAGKSAILDQTTPGPSATSNFDTSDFDAALNAKCGVRDTNPADAPTIEITVNGVTTKFNDTGRVLDTGGFDARCDRPLSEYLPWTPAVGSVGVPEFPVGSLPLIFTAVAVLAVIFLHKTGTRRPSPIP